MFAWRTYNAVPVLSVTLSLTFVVVVSEVVQNAGHIATQTGNIENRKESQFRVIDFIQS